MKSFGPKAWVFPQPVLIIGTYDKDGKCCLCVAHHQEHGKLPVCMREK